MFTLLLASIFYGNYASEKTGDQENFDNIFMTLRTVSDLIFGVFDYVIKNPNYIYSYSFLIIFFGFISSKIFLNYFVALLSTVYE